MGYNTLKLEKDEGILTVKLSRPEAMNALNRECFDELEKVIEIAGDDPGTRVLVLTGEGRAFCAGGDMSLLKIISESSTSQMRFTVLQILRQIGKLADIEKPVIAAINGPAVGVGLTMALLADLRVAAENAVLSMEFVRVGIIPEAGGTFTLARLVGYGKAMELALTGKRITGREAAEIGLVNKAVPPEELSKAALELAADLCRLPAVALGLIKRSMRAAVGGSLEAALECEATLNSICYSSEDHKEAVKAFLEKRPPKFTGK